MKEVVVIATTLLAVILFTNSSVYATSTKQSPVYRESIGSKQASTLLAQNDDFIALAQQADRETALALEQWEQYYQLALATTTKKEFGNLDYLISVAQNISGHHSNAAKIAQQMSAIAPSGNNEQKFLTALIENNTQAANSFSGFARDYSQLKTSLNLSGTDEYIQSCWEALAKIKQHRSIGTSNFNTVKQFVLYAGYRYYPYLGGDPQAVAAVAALINKQSGSIGQSGNDSTCVGAANCTPVPSR